MGFGDLQCSLPATREGAPLDPVPKRRGAPHRARGKKKGTGPEIGCEAIHFVPKFDSYPLE